MTAIGKLDRRLTKALQEHPRSWRPFLHGLTMLGLPVITCAVALIASAISWSVNRTFSYAWLLGCVALLVNSILKLTLRRSRPETLYVNDMRFKSYSFPSGHAFGSLVLYGFAAYLAVTEVSWGAALATVLVMLILLIGFSRVYLGAHYVFDVLGGWLLGGLVLYLLITFASAS